MSAKPRQQDPLVAELDRLRARVAELESAAGRSSEECAGQQLTPRTHETSAKRALQTTATRYRLLIERMNEGFVATDVENRIDIANAKFEEMLETSREEMKGQYLGDYCAASERQILEQQEARRHDGLAEPYEMTWTSKSGREIETIVSPTSLQDADGNFVGSFAVITDVTEHKQMQRERLELEARVRKAQKMESLGLLAGGVAHDFNNLLVGILGNAGLALIELDESAPATALVQQIETAAIRASELTQEMLAYSGKGKFLVEVIDLSQLVEEMAQLLRATISKKASLQLDFASDLVAIEGDPTQIRQVVMNLITNASEALADRAGTVSIKTARLEVTRDYLAETYIDDQLAPGTYALLEVSDSGTGMDQETRSRIFDPFFTTKFTGRGLGLAAVLGIVRGHQGAIRVYSELGLGTSFKVLIPLAAGMVEHVEVPQTPSIHLDGSGCILVVDDEEVVRNVARLTLQSAGYEVLLARDGVEALEIFSQNHDRLSAVLLDMTMPRMGGDEAYEEMRRMKSDVKIILSSGFNEQDAVVRFDSEQLAGFLQKPFQPRELLAKLRDILDK